MIGRKVKTFWGDKGEVTKWEPLGAAMCDVLVLHDDGKNCWHASHTLQPTDNLGPLPSKEKVRKVERQRALSSLRAIRANHISDFNKPWPGCEHGKVIVGNALNGAIAELEA